MASLARRTAVLVLPRLRDPVWQQRAPARTVVGLAMRGGAGVVAALSAYVLFQVWQRLDANQKKRIAKTILRPQRELTDFRPGALFLARPEKNAFIGELFGSDPGGPIVITGPQGSGKTMIVKRALSNRSQAVYLDLRAEPVATGSDLSVAFVQQCGYLLPPNDLGGRAIFARDAVGSATLAIELDRALKLIADVLRAEKERGWQVVTPDGTMRVVPPLLCIDELNTSDLTSLTDDPAFWRFIDWTLFLTDNRLAHVVFTTALDVADSLDAHPGFRSRRQKVHLDFPRPSSVHDYFHRTLNPFLASVLGARPRPVAAPPPPPPGMQAASEGANEAQTQVRPTAASVASTPEPQGGDWLRSLFFGPKPLAATVASVAQTHEAVVSDRRAAPAGIEFGAQRQPSVPPAVSGDGAGLPSTVVAPGAQAPGPTGDLPAAGDGSSPKASQEALGAALGEGPTLLVAVAKAKEAGIVPAAVTPGPSAVGDGPVPNPTEPQVELSNDGSLVLAPPGATVVAAPQAVVGPAVANVSSDGQAPVSAQTVAAEVPPLAPPVQTAAPPSALAGSGGLYLLEPWEIDRIVETIGGHLKDLDTVVTAIVGTKSWSHALDRLVADSVEQVERLFEQLLVAPVDGTALPAPLAQREGESAGGGTRTAASRRTSVPRSRLLTAAIRNGQPLPSWDYQSNPRGDRLASYARFLRAWALITELAARKYVAKRELADRIFAACPHELDFLADVGIVLSVNVRAATRITIVPSPDGGASPATQTVSQVALPGTYVTASSPRMRQAFRALVADPRLQAAASRIRSSLATARLREEEALLLKRLPEALAERSYWQTATSALLVRDTALRTSVAKELVAMQAAAPTTGLDFLQTGSLTAPYEEDGSAGRAGAGGEGAPSTTTTEAASAGAGDAASGTAARPDAGAAPAPLTAAPRPRAAAIPPPPETSLLSVYGLSATLASTLASQRRAEEEVTALRERIGEVRAALDTAEANAEVALPGAVDAMKALGVDVSLLMPGPGRRPRPQSGPRPSPALLKATSAAPAPASSARLHVPPLGGEAAEQHYLGFELTALSPDRSGPATPYAYTGGGLRGAEERGPAVGGGAAAPPLPQAQGGAYWRTPLVGSSRKRYAAGTTGRGGMSVEAEAEAEADHHRDSVDLLREEEGLRTVEAKAREEKKPSAGFRWWL
jgi:hypothetical protein